MVQKDSSREMTFFEHFDELRVRVFRSLIVFFLGFILCYVFLNRWTMDFLRAPLFEIMPPEEQKLYFTSLFENFLTHLKIAGYSSIFLFSPYYFYEFWGFVSPGLYPKERKLVFPFIFFATFFFVGGAAFAYYVLFPVGFKFFVNFGLPSDAPMLTIDAYYGTCLKLLLLFGASFEIPVVTSLLGALGVVDGKTLRKNRQFVIIGITILCAVFAPPDAISMIILMVPLIVMFEGSILVVDWFVRRREAKTNENALVPVGEKEPSVSVSAAKDSVQRDS